MAVTENLWGKEMVWRKGRQLRGTRGPSRVGFLFIVWLCGSRCHGGKRLSPPTSCFSQRDPRCVPGHSNGHSYLWAGVMGIKGPTLECGIGDFFLKFYLVIYFFGSVGSSCCVRAFSSCGKRGLLFVAVRGLLIAVAFLVVEHRL